MSDLVERLRIDMVTASTLYMNDMAKDCAAAAAEIERMQERMQMMHKEIEEYTPWRELQRENKMLEELTDRQSKHISDLAAENEELRKRVRMLETANGTYAGIERELAALKALSNDAFARAERSDALKAQSAEPVAWIHEDAHGFYEFTDHLDPLGFAVYTTPTASIESFKRRAVEECDRLWNTMHHDAMTIKAAIESLPLIEEK